MPLPGKVSNAVRRLNPHIFGQAADPIADHPGEKFVAHRLRQNRGPKTNKTEAAFEAYFSGLNPGTVLLREGVMLLLCNGVRYTADFAHFDEDRSLSLYEVKGPKMWDDAAVKIKVAASVFPKVSFWLATPTDKTKTRWRIERVYP